MDEFCVSDCALFLDLDGTVLEIAAEPEGVVVPAALAGTLRLLERRLDGALAVVTGRSIADVDRFLSPMAPIAAGIHGAELRTQTGGSVRLLASPVDETIVEAVRHLAGSVDGALVELKAASVALHYRLAPAAEAQIEAALNEIVARGPRHLILCRGRKVFEIVPRHVSKGAALEAFMKLPQFIGRRPVMIGDDVSDLSAFACAESLGGRALKVAGELFSREHADFACPAAVRSWLAAQLVDDT